MTEPVDVSPGYLGLSGAIEMWQARLHVSYQAARVAVHRAGKRGQIRTLVLGPKATVYRVDDLEALLAEKAGA